MPESRLPFIVILAAALISLVLLVFILHTGREILIPLAFSGFLAVLLNPAVNYLHRRRVPRVAAITIAIIVAFVLMGGVAIFFGVQMAEFSRQLPQLLAKMEVYVRSAQSYIDRTFSIGETHQMELFRQATQALMQHSGEYVGGTLLALTSVTILVFLVPVYVFLILYYRDLLVEFIYRLARKNRVKVRDVLHEITAVVQQYLVGRLIETIIIAVLNTLALLLLGIDYPFLFGILAALLNLIPYVGVFLGGLFPTLLALITKDTPLYALGVIGAFWVVQFIDNHVLLPFVVGGRVQINSIVAIASVIAGGQLWGVMGMFLSLPVAAIAKVVFDRIEPLKPWGLVLGDRIPPQPPLQKVHEERDLKVEGV